MTNLLLFFVLSLLTAFCIAQDYSCGPEKPCKIGCCSKTNVCGTGPKFCGSGNFISNCDYKSECDPGYGAQWATAATCPLNVCCSKFGFCEYRWVTCGRTVSFFDDAPAYNVQAVPLEISAETKRLCHRHAKENLRTSVPLGTTRDGAIHESVIVRHMC